MTKRRSDQARRVAALIILVNEKMEELALTIELRRAKGFEAALWRWSAPIRAGF